MIVEKKSWPESFVKFLSGEKNADLRIADFKINAGDTLVLKEYNPKSKKFSGRRLEKKVLRVGKFSKLFKNYKAEDLKKKGLLLIELVE